MTENNLISNNNEVIINKSNKIKKFIKKLYELVDSPSTSNIISWNNSNNGFEIKDKDRFCNEILSKTFKTSNYFSFIRQLNLYNFNKYTETQPQPQSTQSKSDFFYNPFFIKDKKELLIKIQRKKTNFLAIRSSHHKKTSFSISFLSSEIKKIEKIIENYNMKLSNSENCLSFLQLCYQELSLKNANLSQIIFNLNEKEKNLERYLLLTLSNFIHTSGKFNVDLFYNGYNPYSNYSSYNGYGNNIIDYRKIKDVKEEDDLINTNTNINMNDNLNKLPSSIEEMKVGISLYNSKSKKLKYLLKKVKSLIEGIDIDESEVNFDFFSNNETYNEITLLNKLKDTIKSRMDGEDSNRRKRKSSFSLSNQVLTSNVNGFNRESSLFGKSNIRKESIGSLDQYEKRRVELISNDNKRSRGKCEGDMSDDLGYDYLKLEEDERRKERSNMDYKRIFKVIKK